MVLRSITVNLIIKIMLQVVFYILSNYFSWINRQQKKECKDRSGWLNINLDCQNLKKIYNYLLRRGEYGIKFSPNKLKT